MQLIGANPKLRTQDGGSHDGDLFDQKLQAEDCYKYHCVHAPPEGGAAGRIRTRAASIC